MKKITTSIIMALLATGFFACEKEGDFLDKTETTELNRQKVFSDSTLTLEFLTKSYADLAFNWEYRKYGSTRTGNTDATDDGISSTSNSVVAAIINGTLSANSASPYTTSWSVPYDNIRALNVFLAHVDQAPLAAHKKVQLKAEARFMRAWYYGQLLRYFGGVPILGDALLEIDHEFSERRSTYAETVSYIVSELDAAAQHLPREHSGIDFGRVTKGAALALKTRVLLYAASPLFNGGNIGLEIAGTSAEQIAAAGYPGAYDENRWRLARQAAEEVIALNLYGLYEDPDAATNPPGYSFSRVFLRRMNNEYIFQYNLPQNRDMEANFLTPSRSSATYSMPTHNLAQAFGMINGLPISDPASGYNPKKPFHNRDPRFNYTLIYNGTMWHNGQTNKKTAILTQVNAKPDGFQVKTHHTGYYWRKMMEENTAPVGGTNTERCLPLIRYAEILLAHAEASNELNDQAAAYKQLRLIRKRAGILPGIDNSYGLQANLNKAQMRQVIQQERRMEFVFEEHRFWDLRRWKIAEQTLNNLQLLALKITPLTRTQMKYEEVPINHVNSKLVFLKPNYLFPIPQTEINRNGKLVQNPGY